MHDPYKYKTTLWLLTLYGVNNPFFPFCFLFFILSVVIIKSSQVSFRVIFLVSALVLFVERLFCLFTLKYGFRLLSQSGEGNAPQHLQPLTFFFSTRFKLSKRHLTPSSSLSLSLQPSHAFFAITINNVVPPTASPLAAAIIGIISTAF